MRSATSSDDGEAQISSVIGTQSDRESKERLHVAILAVLSVMVLFTDASIKELHGTAVFYASLIREIIDTGDPLLIYTDDRAYLLKPPLVVWLSTLSCKVFGLNNFGVTFVSRFAGVGVVLLSYVLIRRWWSHPVAWLAAFAILTNSTFVQFTATLRMDSLLMFGLLMSVVGWAYRDANWGAAALFGGITIAVLSKGPLGFAAAPLILAHALLLRSSPLPTKGWRWSLLLLPIVAWYATLVGFHGAKPFVELSADTLRGTATPQLDVWQSIYQEYLVKPARRYWPWLPLMLFGAMIAVRRSFDNRLMHDMRIHYLWVLLWILVVLATAALKPDHDIRYLYPALPVLGLFTGLAIAKITGDRLPTWGPVTMLVVVSVGILLHEYNPQPGHDTRTTIAAIRAASEGSNEMLAIGGYPVPPGQPRRQNTHRDWVHFYTGSVPRVLSWSEVQDSRPDMSNGVFLTESRGHQDRLAAFDLDAKFITNEMIFAVPK